MSKIDKLSILGIRSFDNTRSETIQFHTPLTLIVGYNGSGKTSIIECLKYATTGDLPPNSKGGAFIHDPKLCGEKEVLAQVKLSFKGTSGAKMVATRSLQLTVKKTTRQQKTLEGQLLMIKDGERTAISSRVAELDQIMPQYLGVSKAILDSVIFCHQDESLWPMSEPSVLKKKFDEIFEALKYTKAIDNIKQLRKKQNEELAKFKITEQYAKEDKAKADKAEKKSRDLHEEIETLREETRDLGVKARNAGDKAQEAWNQGAQFEHVVESLKLAREKQDWLQKNVEDIGQDLKERSESDEWLQCELDQYKERADAQEQHRQSQTKVYENLKKSIDTTRERLRSKHVEAGKYEEQKTAHGRQLENRTRFIRDSARQHQIRGYDGDLGDMQVKDFMDRIGTLYKAQSAAVDKARRETEREMQRVQDVLSGLGERRSTLNEQRNSAKRQSALNDQKTSTLQSEIDKISTDEGGKALIEQTTKEFDQQLRKAREDFAAASWDSRLRESQNEMHVKENRAEQLSRELVLGTKQADDLARLSHLKKEVSDAERGLKTMKGAHGDRLGAILDPDWSPSTLEDSFQAIIDQRSSNVKAAERERDSQSTQLEQVEYKLNGTRSLLVEREEEARTCADRITKLTGGEPEDYPKDLEECEASRDEARTNRDGFIHEKQYWKSCLATADKDQKCRLCNRGFKGKPELDIFIQRMNKLIAKEASDVESDLMELENELQGLRELGNSYETWSRLTKIEIPKIREDRNALEKRRSILIIEVENGDRKVRDEESAKRDADTLAKPVAAIVKYHNDIEKYNKQILDAKASQSNDGLARTMDEVEADLETVNGDTKALRTAITKMIAEREAARSQISALELKLSEVRNSLTEASHQLEKRSSILAQVDGLMEENQRHRRTILDLDEKIRELAPKISEEEAKLEDARQRGSSKESALQQEATRLSDNLHKLRLADQEIQTYVDNGGSAKLDRCLREIDTAQQEIMGLEDEQKHIAKEINRISQELHNHQETKRNILENIKYRRSLRELQDVKAEIQDLSAQNAEADLEHYKQESLHWQRQHKVLSTEETSKMAIMKTKDDQLLQLLHDWNTDYKDAAYKYKEAHINVEATKAAVEDLGRYGGALDNAIMRYHSLKMEEINRIIEELWKKTYQGTDIDTILIRSDNEAAKGNRSYNYRVCMAKQEAEMDMRGRCSAGQRVLASIIIRLALAECFGVNCGLIALDEPTTNLDRDNIRSLAESLHDIIRARRQQSNFQLIVITHDEEFLRYMQCSDFCDNYYRVSRNERQKSIIERQSIAEVM